MKVICTTDDPVDDLEHQTKIAQDPTCKFKVYPAWRPDKVLNIERGGFVDYMNRLSRVSGIHCLNLESMMRRWNPVSISSTRTARACPITRWIPCPTACRARISRAKPSARP